MWSFISNIICNCGIFALLWNHVANVKAYLCLVWPVIMQNSVTEFLMCFLFDEKYFVAIMMHSKLRSLNVSA